MSTPDPSPNRDGDSSESATSPELQSQVRDVLMQLPPERLQALADFAGYLASAEGAVAAQELMTIPGLLERIQGEQAPPSDPS